MTATVLPFEAEADSQAVPLPVEAEQVKISKPVLLLNLKFKRPGNSRKADLGQVQTDADKSALRLSKELLASPELERIAKEDGRLTAWIRDTRALPGENFFREGIYRLALDSITEVDDRLKQHQANRADLVEAFVSAYPERKWEAQRRLQSQFNPNDYPPVSEIAAGFSMEWRYFVMSTPAELGSVSEQILREERLKASETARAEALEVRYAMREMFQQIVTHAVERLGTEDDGKREGKPKIFKDSMVDKFQDFLSTFGARNVTDDSQLAALVDQAKQVMRNVNPDKLRASDYTRQATKEALEAIKPALDAMLIDRPTRGIILTD